MPCRSNAALCERLGEACGASTRALYGREAIAPVVSCKHFQFRIPRVWKPVQSSRIRSYQHSTGMVCLLERGFVDSKTAKESQESAADSDIVS